MLGIETGLVGGFGLLVLLVAGLILLLYLVPIPLWISAWSSGAYVGLLDLIGMRLRRVPPSTVVTARISSVKAGIDISINDLEAHYLAGGNVVRVVNAMISADKANIALPFKRAAAIDLAGRNVLENPDHISKHILSKGLDAGTAYEILSIDIADVDVGENIGAKLQIDQANADKQIAQAKAEERRAMAVALEQEMRARVVEAEAEVPRAMAEAFRQGNLGISSVRLNG